MVLDATLDLFQREDPMLGRDELLAFFGLRPLAAVTSVPPPSPRVISPQHTAPRVYPRVYGWDVLGD